jgi:hypothetical protein
MKRRLAGKGVGDHGTVVQVSWDWRALRRDMKSQTAKTWDCMKRRRWSGVRMLA